MINSSPAAMAVAGNEDLLISILLRLPARSLMKFKCVSKKWLCLISSTEFGIAHTRFCRSNSTPTALVLRGHSVNVVPLNLSTRKESLPSFDFIDHDEMLILQSCNGLLLCQSKQNLPEINCVVDELVICNPTTRQSRRLSCSASLHEKCRMYGLRSVSLAFDPNISPHYKLISILEHSLCAPLEFYVYSSENDSWTSQTSDATGYRWEFCHATFFGNLCAFCSGGIQIPRLLFCFLFDAPTFKKLYLPDELSYWYFGQSQGQFTVVGFKDEYNGYVLEIAADYSGWSMKYHINLYSLKMAFPGCDCCILSYFNAENDESVIVLRIDIAIVRFNLPDGTYEKIYDMRSRPGNGDQPLDSNFEADSDEFPILKFDFQDSYPYFESLVSV